MPSSALLDLLVDPEDCRDLLAAITGQDPGPKSKRDTLRALDEALIDLSAEHLISSLLRYCKRFSDLVEDICSILTQINTNISGTIQISDLEVGLNITPLRSGWAFEKEIRRTFDVTSASEAARSIDRLAKSISFFSLYGSPPHYEDSEIGSMLRKRAEIEMDMSDRILADMLRQKIYLVHPSDVAHIVNARNEVERAISKLPFAQNPPLQHAIKGLEHSLRILESRVRTMARIDALSATPRMSKMYAKISEVLATIETIFVENAEAKRTELMLADFVRTEFWRQRWRIYEIWILTLVIRFTLQYGAAIELLNIESGVWVLRYARASRPCAVAHLGAKDLYLYYQLHIADCPESNSGMPDIILAEEGIRGATAILVIDPKHGRSYTRGTVRKTLNRYRRLLEADLTAIVNYYEHPSYPFLHFADGTHQSILASGAQPDSLVIKRLESAINGVLLARGYV